MTKPEVASIARVHLDRIVATATARGKSVAMTPEAIDAIVREGYSMAYGARFLKRVIDDLVKIPLSQVWSLADAFTVDVVRGQGGRFTGRGDCDERGGVLIALRDSRSGTIPAIRRRPVAPSAFTGWLAAGASPCRNAP